MQTNKEESKADQDTDSSISSQSNALSSDVSCCTRSTTTTTTTTTSSDSSEGMNACNHSDVPHTSSLGGDLSQKICDNVDATEESRFLRDSRDAVIKKSQLSKGQESDRSNGSDAKSGSQGNIATKPMPSTSRAGSCVIEENATVCSSNLTSSLAQPAFDSNNNKGAKDSSEQECPAPSRRATTREPMIDNRNLFRVDKQRFISEKPDTKPETNATRPPHICDCLAQDCQEEEHSNRRQFIEHYYVSRARLPTLTSDAMSSLNIYTPLNRLNECDAITKRLLSSPIRGGANLPQSPERRKQVTELDKSRRASLGTNTLTDQIPLFSKSYQYKSLEMGCEELSPHKDKGDPGDDRARQRDSTISPISQLEMRLKHYQGRSLSVCHEGTQKSRSTGGGSSTNNSDDHNHRNSRSQNYHFPNLNRAISLACDSSSSLRLLTIIPLFGCDMLALEQFLKFGLILPPPIDSAIDLILKQGVKSVGIFRKSGVKSRILNLRQRIEANQYVRVEELNRDNEFSIYDVADLVKMWFRELKPGPMMTRELIEIISGHSNCSQEADNARGYTSQMDPSTISHLDVDLKNQIISKISSTHKALFFRTFSFFSTIAAHSEINQMTTKNLAICLAPSLCDTGSDQGSIMVAQRALKYCLDNYRNLF